jgi:hypothetical protein
MNWKEVLSAVERTLIDRSNRVDAGFESAVSSPIIAELVIYRLRDEVNI